LVRLPEKILEPPEAFYKTRLDEIVSNMLDLISENICKHFQSRRILSTLLGCFACLVGIRIIRSAEAIQGQVFVVEDLVPIYQLPGTLERFVLLTCEFRPLPTASARNCSLVNGMELVRYAAVRSKAVYHLSPVI
jgi:hypothetical protein